MKRRENSYHKSWICSRIKVIVTDDEDKNVEKSKIIFGDRINAGLYIFSNIFLNRIEVKLTSIESEILP